MTCERIRDLLEDYHRDRLGAETQLVERHLAECAECREDLDAVRVVAARVGELPRSIVPERELWQGIEHRIRPGRRIALLAASLLVLLLPALFLLRGDGPSTENEVGRNVAELAASYRAAAAELATQIPEARPGAPLGPSVARQLRTLDGAIEESEAAFRDDPGNPALQELLLSMHRKKLHVLRQAAALQSEG